MSYLCAKVVHHKRTIQCKQTVWLPSNVIICVIYVLSGKPISEQYVVIKLNIAFIKAGGVGIGIVYTLTGKNSYNYLIPFVRSFVEYHHYKSS